MKTNKDSKTILLYNKSWNMKKEVEYNFAISDGFELTTEHKHFNDAVAVIFHMPTLSISMLNEVRDKKIPGQLWVFWTMECELHYSWQYESEIIELFDIQATYKSDCDIPTFYINPYDHELLRTPPIVKTEFINTFISSDFDLSNRTKYLGELMQYLDVHSYGKLFNNKSIANDNGIESKADILPKYKFSLAFENAKAKDYVTEKIYQPLIAGSVPIYLGAPNVEDFLPGDHSYINVDAFNSVRSLADYLLELNHNEVEYQKYLRWKSLPFRDIYEAKATAVQEPLLEKLCKVIKYKQTFQTNVKEFI